MPDYKNEPAGIEPLMPWSDFIEERCSGFTDTEKNKTRNPRELTNLRFPLERERLFIGYL